MSKLKFTIEVEGLDIPEKHQAEISKALNQAFMHKLGELDLAGEKAKTEAPTAVGGGFIFQKWLINGGRILQLMSNELKGALSQIENQHGLANTTGPISIAQRNSIG
jgi:hypothetical protein